MTDTEEQMNALVRASHPGLPVPRLQLAWTDETERDGRFLSKCYYVLVLPVNRYDVRNIFGTNEDEPRAATAVMMGLTRADCGGPAGDKLETPYRDGAHGKWDMEALGLPLVVTRGEKFKFINEGDKS